MNQTAKAHGWEQLSLDRATHATKGAWLTWRLHNDGKTVATIDQLRDGRLVVFRNGRRSRPIANMAAALIEAAG